MAHSLIESASCWRKQSRRATFALWLALALFTLWLALSCWLVARANALAFRLLGGLLAALLALAAAVAGSFVVALRRKSAFWASLRSAEEREEEAELIAWQGEITYRKGIRLRQAAAKDGRVFWWLCGETPPPLKHPLALTVRERLIVAWREKNAAR